MPPKMHTKLRFTGPHGAPYQLGDAICVYADGSLLATVESVLLKSGTEVQLAAVSATPMLPDDERNAGALIFYELCAFMTERFPQIQAIRFSFARPIGGLGPPSTQAVTRVAVAERIGAVDIRVTALASGGYAVSGVWPYGQANVAALHAALEEHRARYHGHALVSAPRAPRVWSGLRRLLCRRRAEG
jgi:hypothetical protein